MQDNPDWNGCYMYLYSETGYNLTIGSDGQVLGTQTNNDGDTDPHSRLEVSSAGGSSLVKIRGLESQLYLCFDCQGNLYGEADPTVEATTFEEHFQGSYSAFKSKVYPDWYVGIKKSGCAKNGSRTDWGQKAVKFLPRGRNVSS